MKVNTSTAGDSSSMFNRILLPTAALLVGGLFLIAAFSKTVDPARTNAVMNFLMTKHTPSLSSPWRAQLADVFVGVLVGVEFAIGSLMLFAPRSRLVLGTACALMVIFTVFLLTLAVDPTAPSCGCLGLVKARRGAQTEAWLGVARNVAAVWILVWMWTRRSFVSNSLPTTGASSARDVSEVARTSRGFTIIELLVVLVIVGILLSLALPAFSRASDQATISTNLSLQRQVHAALMLYAADFQESFVYLATPKEPYQPLVINGFEFPYPSYFGGQSSYYVSALVDNYLPRVESITPGRHDALFRLDFEGALTVYKARFHLTNTVAAAPAYWAGESPPTELSLLRGTKLGDVVLPSSKGLTVDFQTGFFDPSTPIQNRSAHVYAGFADGSAGALDWVRALERKSFVDRPFGASNWPVFTTVQGLHGQDR